VPAAQRTWAQVTTGSCVGGRAVATQRTLPRNSTQRVPAAQRVKAHLGALGTSALGASALGASVLGASALGTSVLGASALGAAALGAVALGASARAGPAPSGAQQNERRQRITGTVRVRAMQATWPKMTLS
jgi:hypothetical protein